MSTKSFGTFKEVIVKVLEELELFNGLRNRFVCSIKLKVNV